MTVLVNPSSPKPPPTYFGPPHGLSMVAACLEQAGWPVKCFDFDRVPGPELWVAVKEVLVREKPRFLGLSCHSMNRDLVYDIIQRVKKTDPGIVVILGGPFPTLEPELLVANFPADFAVIGEGELTAPALWDCIETGGDPSSIPGLAFLRDGTVIRTETRAPILDLDPLPLPAFHLFDLKRQLDVHKGVAETAVASSEFVKANRLKYIQSGITLLSHRGCLFSCTFCPESYNKLGRFKVRSYSPKRFVDIIEHFYREYGLRDYVFGDNLFTYDRARAMEICDEVLRRDLDISWITMTRADYVDAELLKKMGAAGCVELAYGVESGSPEVQRAIRKNLKLHKVPQAFSDTRDAGIASVLMLMVGNPGESEETMRQTVALAQGLEPDRIRVEITKTYPGTVLHDAAQRAGLIPADFYLTARSADTGRQSSHNDKNTPFFTLERTEAELLELRAMLQPRRVYLEPAADFSALRRALLVAVRRSDFIYLGGQPLLRPDFPEVIAEAGRLDIHHLIARTDAAALILPARAQALRKLGAMEDLLIDIYSHRPVDHEARSGSSLAKTFCGALNWKKAGGRIEARVQLRQDNIGELVDITRLLLEMGVDETLFVYRRSPEGWMETQASQLPKMAEAAARAADAIARLRERGKEAGLSGIPACVAGEKPYRAYEPYRPFDEKIDAGGGLESLRKTWGGMKQKVAACAGCRLNPICDGVWKDYLQRHGDDEIRPL